MKDLKKINMNKLSNFKEWNNYLNFEVIFYYLVKSPTY